MQRTSETQNKKDGFPREVLKLLNNRIHDDLVNSQNYLEKYELDDYINNDELDIHAINRNQDLTVEQVTGIGVHFARWCIHKNLHEALDVVAKQHGLNKKTPNVQVVTDIKQLPPEIQEALGEALKNIIKRRGGGN